MTQLSFCALASCHVPTNTGTLAAALHDLASFAITLAAIGVMLAAVLATCYGYTLEEVATWPDALYASFASMLLGAWVLSPMQT